MHFASILPLFIASLLHMSLGGVEIFFPDSWNGDAFQKAECPSRNIPQWLDGYFFVQTAASYGKQSAPFGEKLVHLFDGIGAVSSFEIGSGQVKFSAKYYPSRTYKIWDFYNRDVSQSKVAWLPFQSPYNVTAYEMWKHIPLYADDGIFQSHPNIDFWRIGHQVIGATENVDIGMAFDPTTLTNFKHPNLIETNDIYKHTSTIIPLTMAVHERNEPDGSVYAVNAAFDPMNHKMFQMVAKITPDGTRTLEGLYETGSYDPSKCTSDGKYTGDKRMLANYMHSITSTQRYVILPLTSIIFNPCKLPPLVSGVTIEQHTATLPSDVKENYEVVEYSTDVPLKFLVFDKSNKKFVTETPIEIDVPMTPVHQWNAYEDTDGTLIVDLGAMDGVNGRAYNVLTLDRLMHEGVGKAFRLLRFRINMAGHTANYTNILNGQDYVDGEFPNFNHNFMGQKYKYGYMMTGFLVPGAKISKIDMDGRAIIGEFSAPNGRASGTVFREPWFVPRPGGTEEDDGIILVLGGDINSQSSTLYVVDARTMNQVGGAEIPTVVPLGLHNRFFFRNELGLPPTPAIRNGFISNGENFMTPTNGIIPNGNGFQHQFHQETVQISPFENAYWNQRQAGLWPKRFF